MHDADQLLTNLHSAREALAYSERALAEAERFDASAEEILHLCDEVISRRITVNMCRLELGERMSLPTLAQLERDEALVGQFVSAASRG